MNIILINISRKDTFKKSHIIVYQSNLFGFRESSCCRPTGRFVSYPSTINITVSLVVVKDYWA